MSKYLSLLGPGARLSIAASLFVLSPLMGWLSLRSAENGPWYVAMLLMVVSAMAMTVGFTSWPDKLPSEVQTAVDKWNKAKKNSTKSAQGRFVWKLGRSAIAAMLAFQMLPVELDGGFFRLAFVLGLGFSIGFFGVRAALWSGACVYLIAHRTALNGLVVDFSDPYSREALWAMWNRGGSMSWWWAIGLGLCPLIWVGMSGLMVKVGSQLSEELAERRAAAIAKKKIEARRARLKSRQEANSSDPLLVAQRATELAKKRATSIANKDVGYDDLSALQDGEDSKELRGVAKIEHDKNELQMQKYADYAKSIQNSEEIGIDVDTVNRRAFDRVVQGLTDSHLDHLKSAKWGGAAELLAYYNRICGFESEVMSGGDGEIVTTRSGADGSVDLAATLPVRTESESNSEDDGIDLLDGPRVEVPVTFSRPSVGDGALQMMLSEINGSADVALADDTAEEDEIMSGQTRSPVFVATASDEDSGDILDGNLPIVSDADVKPAAEPTDNDPDVASEVLPDAVQLSAPAEESAAEDVLAGPENSDVLASEAVEVTDVTVPALAPDLRRLAAGRILAGDVDRELIFSTLGSFDTVSDLAGAIGLPETLFGDQFAKYDAMARAARDETALVAMLDSEAPDLETVRSLTAALADSVSIWAADDGLLPRAEAWVASSDEEAKRLEDIRQEEERAHLASAAKLREAEEARLKEEAERLEETKRIAAEKEDADRRDREAEAEEKDRLDGLQALKGQYANRILVGSFSDEVLIAGLDLFPTIEAFSEATSLPVDLVQERFDEFHLKCNAKAKFEELREAMADESNIELVRALIASPESFEGYEHSSLSLSDAAKWIDGVEVKHRVVGLADDGIKAPGPASEESGKLFMKKRLGTPNDLIELIEKTLPAALMLEKQLARVISLMPKEDPTMIAHRDRAAADAARAAAQIVNEEKRCKEYVMAFFPSSARPDDMLVWDMILGLAAKASQLPAEEAAQDEKIPAQAKLAKPQRANGALSTPISFSSGIKTEEELHLLDPMEMISEIDFFELKSREDIERSFRFSYKGMFAQDPVTKSNPMNHSFEVCLGEEFGFGKIVFFTNLNRIPLWYEAAAEKVICRHTPTNTFVTHSASSMMKGYKNQMGSYESDDDRVRGIIIVSPYITEDGERTFNSLLKTSEQGPIIIQNNDRLNSEVFRAFVDRIKGA